MLVIDDKCVLLKSWSAAAYCIKIQNRGLLYDISTPLLI